MYRYLIFIIFFANCSHAQLKFQYQKIKIERTPSAYSNENAVIIPRNKISNSAQKNTLLINQYLLKYSIVKLPNIAIIVDSSGVTLNDNNILIFDNETSLNLVGNNLERYEIVRIHNVRNVQLYNPTIIGDRLQHKGNKGEWGHGISILSSQNINVYNYKIEKCWGDGLYIGKLKTGTPSKDIYLYDGILDFNRRNGLSITSAMNVTIDKLFACNTYGTLPMYGLDIEPNSSKDVIDNIKISRMETSNNFEGGLMVAIHKMADSKIKNVNILVDNYKDSGSKRGFFFGGIPLSSNIKGLLELKNINLERNNEPFKFRSNKEAGNFIIKADGFRVSGPANFKFNHKQISKTFNNNKIEVRNLQINTK